jgi:hypothetical protein
MQIKHFSLAEKFTMNTKRLFQRMDALRQPARMDPLRHSRLSILLSQCHLVAEKPSAVWLNATVLSSRDDRPPPP